MAEFSLPRVVRLTIILGAAGAIAVFAKWGAREAAEFLIGAALSLISFRSWARLAESVGNTAKRPATGSAMFLAMRYVLIGAAIYVIMNRLGASPAFLIVGLLVSFAAVALELLLGLVVSK